MKRVMIVNPPSPGEGYINRDMMGGFGADVLKSGSRVPNLNLLYVTSLLREHKYDVHLLDAAAEELTQAQTEERVNGVKPDILVINIAAPSFRPDVNFAEAVRKSTGAYTVLVGSHASVIAKEIINNVDIDAVLKGEPEYTTLEIADRISKGEKLKGTKGAFHKEDGEIHFEESREPIKDLDELPFPAHDLLNIDLYRFRDPSDSPMFCVLTSRGCPMGCVYCPYPVAQGAQFRFRSPENVVAEMKMLVEQFGAKAIVMRDPIFSVNRKRTVKICELMIEAKLDLKWRCETSIGSVDKELLDLMKEAGCVGINFGLETGNEEMIKKYSKKMSSKQKAIEMFHHCNKIGLRSFAFFIVGLPGETRETLKDTTEFIMNLDPFHLTLSAAAAFPGTKLYEQLIIEGKIDPFKTDPLGEITSLSVSKHTDSYAEGLSKEELRQEMRKIFRKFYTQPHVMWRRFKDTPVGFISSAINAYIHK